MYYYHTYYMLRFAAYIRLDNSYRYCSWLNVRNSSLHCWSNNLMLPLPNTGSNRSSDKYWCHRHCIYRPHIVYMFRLSIRIQDYIPYRYCSWSISTNNSLLCWLNKTHYLNSIRCYMPYIYTLMYYMMYIRLLMMDCRMQLYLLSCIFR